MSKLEIRSPLPGTFYRKPSPDAAPYKADGDSVAVGDVIGLIEVMKTFREVHADAAGKIAAGALMVQFYSGLVFRGPDLIAESVLAIKRRREGVA